MIRTIAGKSPRVAGSAFIEPSAAVIGDVTIGAESSVWFHCVLRGDINFIRIGQRTNIQDLSVLHVLSEDGPVILGDDVTIGHRAVVHGCTIRDRVLVGMGSIVLDRADVREDTIIGAGALVTPGSIIPSRSFVLGSPAKVRRPVTDEELEWIRRSAAVYVGYAGMYRSEEASRIHPPGSA